MGVRKIVTPLDVRCPVCDAGPGELCTTGSTLRRAMHHLRILRVAR